METIIIVLLILLIFSVIKRPTTYKYVYVIYYRESENIDWKRWPGVYNTKNECIAILYEYTNEYQKYNFICAKEII